MWSTKRTVHPESWRQAIALAVLAVFANAAPAFAQEHGPDRWERAMLAFEEADRRSPPAKGSIVFLGSSSFRRWDLDRYFPGRGLINRGFGGSQMVDALRYLDRIVLPLEPRAVFLYEGDNDTGSGKSPETVAGQFQDLAAKIHADLPEARIVFVSIKPSLRRWHLIEVARKANDLIRKACAESDLLEYVDAATPLLGADGLPRPDLFVEDGLHLNDAGYRIWATVLEPYLD